LPAPADIPNALAEWPNRNPSPPESEQGCTVAVEKQDEMGSSKFAGARLD
jgi:hypothetical protein